MSNPTGVANITGGTWLDSTSYFDESGQVQGTLATLLDGWSREIAVAVPMDGTTEISGTHTLQQPIWLPFNGVLAEVTGFNWTAPIEHMTNSIKVDLGDRIVDLILRSVQLPSN